MRGTDEGPSALSPQLRRWIGNDVLVLRDEGWPEPPSLRPPDLAADRRDAAERPLAGLPLCWALPVLVESPSAVADGPGPPTDRVSLSTREPDVPRQTDDRVPQEERRPGAAGGTACGNAAALAPGVEERVPQGWSDEPSRDRGAMRTETANTSPTRSTVGPGQYVPILRTAPPTHAVHQTDRYRLAAGVVAAWACAGGAASRSSMTCHGRGDAGRRLGLGPLCTSVATVSENPDPLPPRNCPERNPTEAAFAEMEARVAAVNGPPPPGTPPPPPDRYKGGDLKTK